MTTENQSKLPDKKRLEEIRRRQVLRGNANDRWYVDDVDYLPSLLQQLTTSERRGRGRVCYAQGDEGARCCGAPEHMHCDTLGDASFWESPAGQRHLVECMRDAHLIHHAF